MRYAFWFIIGALITSCNSNLHIVTTAGFQAPAETDGLIDQAETQNIPEDTNTVQPEFSGEFNFAKNYVQTRSAITLHLNNTLIENGEHFNLWNETKNAKILNDQAVSFALTSGLLQITNQAASLDLTDLGMGTIAAYGLNHFRLDILDATAPRYAQGTLTLKDFIIFSPALTHFDSHVQKQSNFQGWLNAVNTPNVGANGHYLVVGMPEIINR